MVRGNGFGRRFDRGAARPALALLMAVAMLAAYAGTAVAHSSSAWLTCHAGLEVYLWAYEVKEGETNNVSVSIDGAEVAGSPFTFGADFGQTWPVVPATAGHTALVDIVAWDDPTGAEGWTRTIELSINACEDPTEPPVTEPPVTEPPVTEPPVTEPPVTEPPVTEPPVTEPPVTEPPVTEPPVTEPPPATPSGTVESETGTPVPTDTPDVTLPPTDSVGSSDAGTGPGVGLAVVLVLLAGGSVAILPASRRRPNR